KIVLTPNEARTCKTSRNNPILDDNEDNDETQAIDPDCAQQTANAGSVNLVGDGNETGDVRCEHHNEVSQHRYRYVTPATPKGFWNIGFDNDL
ncbi:hypothetical protein KI387_008696, partial [Taxus chinensis]